MDGRGLQSVNEADGPYRKGRVTRTFGGETIRAIVKSSTQRWEPRATFLWAVEREQRRTRSPSTCTFADTSMQLKRRGQLTLRNFSACAARRRRVGAGVTFPAPSRIKLPLEVQQLSICSQINRAQSNCQWPTDDAVILPQKTCVVNVIVLIPLYVVVVKRSSTTLCG
jgi:hypothetical protein